MIRSRNIENYLIIQTAFLGDVVLSLSMAEYIKKKNDSAKVVFITTSAGTPIVEECEFVDEVISYDKRNVDKGFRGIKKNADKLNGYYFKAVFTPHRSFRSTLLTMMIKSINKYGFDKNSMSWLIQNRIKYNHDKHEIVRNLSLVRSYWNDKSEEIIKPKLKHDDSSNDSIIMAPGSVWNTKRWPEEKWAELILSQYLLDKKVILIGAKSDVTTVDKVMKLVGDKHPSIENRTGKDVIKKTIQIISAGNILISNDSAPQHIAVAVETPVITIYGSTVPAFGFYPVGEFDKIIEIDEELKCRPCTDHGKEKCPIKTFDCMRKIDIKIVVKNIREIFKDE